MGLPMLSHAGIDAVLVLGDPDYYGRFGSLPIWPRHSSRLFTLPHFMALEIAPGCLEGLRGRVRYARAFGL